MIAIQKENKLFVSTLILIIIYFIGLVGMFTTYRLNFLSYTPANLLISSSLLLLNHKEFNKSLLFFLIGTFLFGFFIEFFGVNSGIIFGEYQYGKTLGLKLFNIPIIIGINWMMLIYCVGIICYKLNYSIIIKSLIGAGMLVILDLFIEPVAIKSDFWRWENTSVPLQNYIAWFIVSFLLLIFFNKASFKKENEFAKKLFIVQLVFFTLLTTFN